MEANRVSVRQDKIRKMAKKKIMQKTISDMDNVFSS